MLSAQAALALASLLTSQPRPLQLTPTPLRMPAEVDDVYALGANPAGLAYIDGMELRLVYGRDDRAPGADPINAFAGYAAYGFGGVTLAGSADVVNVDDQTSTIFSLGTGFRRGGFAVGFSGHRVNLPNLGESRTRWDIGVSQRWASWLATGIAVHDVAQTVERRRWDLGLALRPARWLMLSGRWRLTQDQDLDGDTLDVAGLLTLAPIDGLKVGVGFQRAPGFDYIVSGQLELGFGWMALGGAAFASSCKVGTAGCAASETGLTGVAELAMFGARRPSLFNPSKVVVIDVAGELKPPESLNLLSQGVDVPPYGDLPLQLEALAKSDRVAGLFVRIGPIEAGWAKAEEVRDGLVRIRGAGHRVDCQLSGGADLSYYVATACDSIIIAPPSVLRADGVAATTLFFGDALDEIGIDPQVIRRGKYKSAPEQLTRAGMSPEQREALGAYLDGVYGRLVDGIAGGRKLDADKVRGLLDVGAHTATQALARGLVDHLLYPDEVEAHLDKVYGKRMRYSGPRGVDAPHRSPWGRKPRIAVVYVDATITGGESSDLPFGLGQSVGARTLVGALERIRTDRAVKAVVLRVDSPGGDSLASDFIARAVERVAKEKPVIASFGDVAASGGYYVAAPATAIYAEPTTLTGSIGVFSLGVSAERLLSRWGIGVEQLRRGEKSGGGTPYVSWTAAEKAKTDEMVDFYYEQFLSVVARGRKMDRDAVHAVAQGRIWSGAMAKDKGLVDEIGGFMAALERARSEAGLDPDEAVDLRVYPSNRSALPKPLRTLTAAVAGWFGPDTTALKATEALVKTLVPRPLVQALSPWLFSETVPEAGALLPLVLDID